ncbi:hypothetical protein CMUS01_02370 [Colletotrichum musicola]|uniref:Uncharacterized protein n=1 Tax=Colletotrichum musicola TaxID=2175873 RepID=A0A8H6NV94_9PEZI|nr:hypothetical protein CMUS01_02370 [Colletotrichum musicola]
MRLNDLGADVVALLEFDYAARNWTRGRTSRLLPGCRSAECNGDDLPGGLTGGSSTTQDSLWLWTYRVLPPIPR